jgi:hypothetical protein
VFRVVQPKDISNVMAPTALLDLDMIRRILHVTVSFSSANFAIDFRKPLSFVNWLVPVCDLLNGVTSHNRLEIKLPIKGVDSKRICKQNLLGDKFSEHFNASYFWIRVRHVKLLQ